MRYESAEFENAFFPCQSAEVWSVVGGEAFDALVDFYRNSQTNQYGEIRTALELIVSPINRTVSPNSHFDAVVEVTAIISLSEDENEIKSCRNASP